MLVIRQRQVEALERSLLARFAADLAAHLTSMHPHQTAALGDEPALAAFVQRAIDKAVEHGIGNRGGVTILAELMLQFGEDFERSPLRAWTRNVLAQRALPGALRAASLRERYRELTGGRPVMTY